MVANVLQEFGSRGIATVLGLVSGGIITLILTSWRRRKERLSIQDGDARDTVVIHQHLVKSREIFDPVSGQSRRVPDTLRLRVLGQAELNRVVPNGLLASIIHHRSKNVTSTNTLISMDGLEGSYLLETLTGFVGDRTANAPFEHDLYVMAPCCEPKELVRHQPIVIILIRRSDLLLFQSWNDARCVRVEHSSDGARVLTLMQLARNFVAEQDKLSLMRQEGKRVTYVETMYLLDLALDKRSSELPIKPIPWGRFEKVLKDLDLD